MADGPGPSPGLAGSASPFLRHGAEQPVDWLPWGVEALDRARAEDRPILLDIGAAWCHWCHVMDRESYEDRDTAALINELYVPVKVDRDERPDVDARYQRAVQSLAGQGGWPLTAFLTPDGEVFHGGTYFPPEDAHGRPSFRRVLREVARVWDEERERVREVAGAIRERLDRILEGEASPGEIGPSLIDRAVDDLAASYDPDHGGFGGAPKFPNAGGLGLLLDRWLDGAAAGSGEEEGERRADEAGAMVSGTLDAMVAGGLHDQIGGGFHRYSTDARWIIPHFEKMAYDNGPLLEVLARAAIAMDSDRWSEAAAGVVRYYRDVAQELVDRGGFPASQDADIGFDDDGDYWTWTERELIDAVGDGPAAEAAALRWGVRDPAGAMHLDPDRHVLFQAAPIPEVARRLDRSEGETRSLLEEGRRRLKDVRDRRPRPYVDESLYTGWVALVASGHLAAARHLGLEAAGRDAVRALDRVWAEAWMPDRGLVHRVDHRGSGIMLGDQGHTARALLDAFEWTQEPVWLHRAGSLLNIIRDRFGHPDGGLVDLPTDGDDPSRPAGERLEITDSPEPSPTAVAAESMARFGALTGDDDRTATARGILQSYAGAAPRFAVSAATYFRALRWVVGPVTTVAVVERAEGADTLLEAALRSYRPATVVRRYQPGDVDAAALPAPLRAMLTGDAPRAYVCAGTTCAAPVAEPGALTDLLGSFRG